MKKYKILTIVDLGGSKYHRIILPMKALNGKVIDINGENHEIQVDFIDIFDPSDDIILKYDMVYFNWNIKIPVSKIGEYQAKGIKFIMDIDDHIKLPSKHPDKKKEGGYKNIPLLAAAVDSVVVATNNLAKYYSSLNDRISIIYNDLPIGQGQFQHLGMVAKNADEKIGIGVVGSYSHIFDYQSIEHNINKICKDPELRKRCKFVIGGYHSSKVWDRIVALFDNKGMEVELVPAKAVDDYMDIYNKVDILMAPLSNCEFNRYKSALKIMEASLRDIPVIASELYMEKEFNNACIVKKSGDYYKFVKELIKNDQYIEIGRRLAERNRDLNNWDGRIENMRKLVEFHANNIDKEIPGLSTYSIKYLEDQPTQFTPYLNKNTETGWRFEYEPMSKIVDTIPEEGYTGIFSWKFSRKTGINKKVLKKMIEGHIAAKEYDGFTFCPSMWDTGKDFLKFSYVAHPELERILKKCLNHIGKEYVENPKYIVYANQFILRNTMYKDYIDNWVKPCLAYMENEIWEEVNIDARYTSGLSSDQLQAVCGQTFYNYITFVLERLIMFYLNDKKIKVVL